MSDTFSVARMTVMATVAGLNDGDGHYVVVNNNSDHVLVGYREGDADDAAQVEAAFTYRTVGQARRAYRDALALVADKVTRP